MSSLEPHRHKLISQNIYSKTQEKRKPRKAPYLSLSTQSYLGYIVKLDPSIQLDTVYMQDSSTGQWMYGGLGCIGLFWEAAGCGSVHSPFSHGLSEDYENFCLVGYCHYAKLATPLSSSYWVAVQVHKEYIWRILKASLSYTFPSQRWGNVSPAAQEQHNLLSLLNLNHPFFCFWQSS